MNDSRKSAFGLRAPFCQFLAKPIEAQRLLADERSHSQLTEIDTWADTPAPASVTRSPIVVQFSTSQTCAAIAHKFIEWRATGRAA